MIKGSPQWFLMVLETIDAVVRETYPRTRKNGPDAELYASLLYHARELDADVDRLREILRESPEFADNQAEPGPEPVPGEPIEPPEGSAASLPLRVSAGKRWFETDAGLYDWREFTAMSLLSHLMQGREAHVREWMARAAAKRMTMLRCAGSLGGPYWRDTARALTGLDLTILNNDQTFTQALALTRMAAEYGLKVRWFIFGDLHELLPDAGSVSSEDWDLRRDVVYGHSHRERALMEFATRFVRAVTHEPNVVWEVANEYKNIGFSRSESFLWKVTEMIRREDPDAMVSVSGIDGAEWDKPTFSRSPATYVSAHISRDKGVFWTEWIKRSGEAAVIDSSKMNKEHHQIEDMPFDHGEGPNFGDLRRDGRNGDVCQSEMAVFASAAHSRARKHNTCYHHDDGLWCMGWGADTDRCIDAWHAGLDAIPMSDADVWRGHWSVSPFDARRFPDTDDTKAVEAFIAAGKGAFRGVGVGDRMVLFPFRVDVDINAYLKPEQSVRSVDQRASDGMKAVAFVVL